MAKRAPREPVAIIGLGLRLPGADSLDGFWDHLAAGRSLISEVPADRWDAAALKGDPAKGHHTSSIWGGFIEDADGFDAALFGISPREAAWMDPQQRFALEMAWHAIEDAGYRPADLAGSRTGVYMGVCHFDYAELLEKHLARVDAYMPTGIALSIIANRVSHFFDFTGPSIANDTACAASMTALYEAVRALQDGECEMALAGGVNLIWSPNHFVAFSKAGMLSKDGQGKAFDDGADGYVRGEGGAVLLLKPLAKALADGDPVHAVVRGIGINHGGRTNSLTVTSPAAQAELIARVHREAGVSPDTVGYVEAHGPGTPLGDPIEISGLKQAFAELAAENGVTLDAASCGVGSVKTNIGHLEGAAGVAGIAKVVAAMKHGRLPANVGFTRLNRLIDLSGTPFRIQSEATDWPRQAGRPRRACVSSFGFGGSNGHVLLEEPPAPEPVQAAGAAEAWQVVPISGATADRLPLIAARLLAFVERGEGVDLADLAHTLQTARAAMPARHAFVARDSGDLAARLRAYLAGADAVSTGPAPCAATAGEGTSSDEAPSSGHALAAADLAHRWMAGDAVDWASSPAASGRRIHAPLYPFERTRHWMDLSLGQKDQAGVPHPLLHRNVSGLDGACFETRFSGDEFVLADHRVGGVAVLPGMASLEMARAAAMRTGELGGGAYAIDNVVWRRPIRPTEGRGVLAETRLGRDAAGGLAFAIAVPDKAAPAAAGRSPAGPDVQGTIRTLDDPAPASADLAALKARMADPLEPETCYARLRASGVDHGPAFRALAAVSRGENEALALLKLPRRLLTTLDAMPLHPVLLDAAIQAWVAIGDASPPGAAIPFACSRIEVFGPCEASMWAHVRLRPGPDAATRHLDIDLFDKSGARKVSFHDLALRVIKAGAEVGSLAVAAPRPDFAASMVLAGGVWQDAPLEIGEADTAAVTRVLLAGWDADLANALSRRTGWPVEALPDVADAGMAAAAETLFASVHGLIGDVIRSRPPRPVDILVLARDTLPSPVTAPLAALLKTGAIENPKIGGRLISLAGDRSLDRLATVVSAEAGKGRSATELRYNERDGRQAFVPVAGDGLEGDGAYAADPEGVYWITGGLGGLGLIFADWLVSRGARKLILSGRRGAAGPESEGPLQRLRDRGARVDYAECDMASAAATARLAAAIQRDYGPLKGIIHAAGVLDDGYILTQDAGTAARVFAPKVAGTVNIDRATRDAPLDFFVLCSSMAAVFGNVGQAVYAAANAFMDGFAEARAAEVAAGRCRGKTVAIAWPLWSAGGMAVDAGTLASMKRRLGLTPMPTVAGLLALDAILVGNAFARTTVLHGDVEKIRAALDDLRAPRAIGSPATAAGAATGPAAEPAAPAGDDEALVERTADHVRAILAEVLEIDAARIRVNQALSDYGLDSIAIIETTERLEEALGPLSKTLLFEYVDLGSIAQHLAREHAPALRRLFASETAASPVVSVSAAPGSSAPKTSPPRTAAAAASFERIASPPLAVPESNSDLASAGPAASDWSDVAHPAVDRKIPDDSHDIAIIGLSLHVSGASDQDSFWTMLSEGRHGFEPVPTERWDNGALYHGERDVLGKTVVGTGAFLPDIEKFDPRYFRISQAEAELMSPEVRLFLQASVEAFEDAGYSRQTMARRYGGDVAVIAGSMTNEYDLYGFQNMLMRGALASGSYTGTVPNMVSYFYGFTGPSYFLDTMCSASSTCVHEAVHMLRAGRCRMALAGGVSLLLHPQKLIATSQEHFTSKSADVIRGYGLGAEGTILGEGVGAVILKRLADAQRDGDHIYGVIIGTGISNAGTRNGFTVPSPGQQAVAIEKALDDAGVSAASIGYVEGHGSGTALGDPIEIRALTQVFRKATDAVQTCPIGTVKSNVAHLLAASGLAGIAKVLAQLKHGQIAPSLHAETLNPDIPFETSPFYVQRELADWTRRSDEAGRELPLRAGVTSIGAGGMNSHIVIEEFSAPAPLPAAEGPELLVFSALDPARLRPVLQRFAAHLRHTPHERLADLAYTLQVGRNELSCRLALVAADRDGALAAIEAFITSGAAGPGMVYVPSILDADPPRDRAALEAGCRARDLGPVAAAWCAGATVDWDLLAGGRPVRRLSLPAYPFEKIRCWYQPEPDAPSVVNPIGARSKLHPFIGTNRSDAQGLRYATAIHLKELRDYFFTDRGRQTLLPTVVPEIVAAALRLAGLGERFVSALEVEAVGDWSDIREILIGIDHAADGTGHTVRIETVDAGGAARPWVRATCTATGAQAADLGPALDLAGLRASATAILSPADIDAALKAGRLSFGPYLEILDQAWRLPGGGVLCRLLPDAPQQDPFKKNTFCAAPAWGGAFQASLLADRAFADSAPWSIAAARVGEGAVVDILCMPEADGRYGVKLLGASGRVVADLSGIAAGHRAVADGATGRSDTQANAPAEGSLARLGGELRGMAAAILKFAPGDLGLRESFHDLGFDSISLTRFAADIGDAYGIPLSPAIFFECAHIEALATHLAARHGLTARPEPVPPAMPARASSPRMAPPRVPEAAAAGLMAGRPQSEPIAVIGMAGRFPGSPDVETFFDNLLAGRDLTSDWPSDRLPPAAAAATRDLGFPLRGGFLGDVDRFDAALFRISPVEAERMDPQQRLLLETAWRALEDSGLAPAELPRDTGVFVGITALDYGKLWRGEGLEVDGYVATGNSLAMAANRLSHQFDLSGPSQAIDTACSSSLIALLRARDALNLRQCSAAIVAGVNLCLSADGFEGPALAGMLSQTGRCSTFGAAADGYARGEGVAALLVKRLRDAERDGDRILGTIIGGAENHGGRSGALTAPHVGAQADLIVAAMAGIDPASVSYVEAHGTGTTLGDPVEINGLIRAFETLGGGRPSRAGSIGLGAVKSAIGHLEAAAGLAGVIKILMAMRRNELPPTLHASPINPHITLDGSPFRLVTAREPWPAHAPGGGSAGPRRAGVSSFGFGGANAHVVLESHDLADQAARPPLPPHPFAATRFWIPGARATGTEVDRLLFVPVWVDRDLPGERFTGRRIAVGCGVAVAAGQGADVRNLAPGDADIGQRYAAAATQLLALLRREIERPGHDPVLIQLAVPDDGDGLVFAGLGALLRSASQEEPRVRTQLLEVAPEASPAQVAEWLADEARGPPDGHSRRSGSRRQVRVWQEQAATAPVHRWRDSGVFLVTGGMGGLGRLVAEDMARTAKSPVIVLAGASPMDDDRAAFLPTLRGQGAVTAYRQVDMADAEAVEALVAHIVEVHGGLHGVVHCAGTLRDGFLAGKTDAYLRAVLAPKVMGALALREACHGLDLDDFVLFSSLAGVFGNAGQADYAAANGFLDGLARASGGRMRAIDWPLWRDGGMTVDPATAEALHRRMGQRPLGKAAGLEALHLCLGGDAPQVAVIAGEGQRIRGFFGGDGPAPAGTAAVAPFVERAAPTPFSPIPSSSAVPPALLPATRAKLSVLFAEISGLWRDAIRPDTPLEDYGIDSLMITRLNTALGDVFAQLPKTLFFRHRTLAAVADYLVDAQPVACGLWTGVAGDFGADPLLPAAGREARQLTPSGQGAAGAGAAPAAAGATPAAAPQEPIAIIGMSGSYPDAPDLHRFWDNLVAGHDAVRDISGERWPRDDFFEPDPDEAIAAGKSYSRWGAFLENFADFDPLFFKISPRDAAAMDPQERLFLTSAWQACEDAGYTPARLKSVCGGKDGARVGVFVGVTKTGFALHGPFRTEGGASVRPSTSFAGMANRVSHLLDLSGPSLPIDTMCSSSLTAIHEACEHLRAGSCGMAIAGGVNLYLHPSTYVELSAARMLSPSGRCRSFGAGADGFVPGEGVGCLLLKPLSRAIADGDRIHALILGSAVNHGGRTSGYTVPNPSAQRDVVRAALGRAGVSAADLGTLEAHGTGTDLGDPIEIDGLTQAFAQDIAAIGSCALGSVKSAIGHLEAAAGIAGLTKIVLQLKNRVLVPTLHADEANPNIDLSRSPFVLQRQAAAWQSERPRIAGVSSFGAGGANAHAVLQEWVEPAAAIAAPPPSGLQAVPLSARNPERLRAAAERLLAFVGKAGVLPAGMPETGAILPALSAALASWLDVEPRDIDPAEDLAALGLEAAHLSALTQWAQARFGVALDRLDLDLAGTVERLAALIGARAGAPSVASDAPRLADIAYTLQVGREAMESRLVILAESTRELAEKLESWLSGSAADPSVLSNEGQASRDVLAGLGGDSVVDEVVGRSWQAGRIETVARLWVGGVAIPWEDLRRGDRARIVSLPTYPFEAQRYWMPSRPSAKPLATPEVAAEAVVRTVTTGRGDTALAAEIEALEHAIAGVLGPILAAIPPTDILAAYRPWAEAARLHLQARTETGHVAEAGASWDAFRQTGTARAQADLAEAALRALPDILTGRRPATEILFPEGRQTLVEAIYKENAVAARFSRTLAETAAGVVAAFPDDGRKLRILEIGAGTGGTSEPVFEALQPHRNRIGEYAYTDVSRAFLIHAERHYADRIPGLKTALFDVERPLAGQGIAAGSYDLVIAANVLHATADIARTLARVRETLAPGGMLLLNETAMPTLFTHVTFGLLDGWWRFTDPERRIAGTPSLTASMWRKALEETGFAWLAGSSAEEQALGQQVIAARATGVQRGGVDSPAATAAAASSPHALPGSVVAEDLEDRHGRAATFLRETLLATLGQTLNVAPSSIDRGRSFADYGLDSILGAEFVHRLRKALDIRLDQARLFDFASAARLEAFLLGQYPALADRASPRVPERAAVETAVAETEVHGTPQPRPPEPAGREPIAIVGASGRFAGSETIDALWAHLVAGDDLVEPATRFDLEPFYRGAEPGSFGRHGSFIESVDRFDPVFFGISGLEATYMDPQQRLFLEEAWKTLENAGHAGADMVGRRCGVFVGCAHGDYQDLFAEQPPGQAFWGNTTSLIPARISYWLDLKGPAIAIDTACSSSLVALHMACQSLWNGDSEMALAGGVFIQSSPRFFRSANAARMLSPSGQCAAFGAGADGIVPGEAVGAVLLRPLSEALADGDTVLGVIIGSGTNQDGTTNGITAPSAASQERLIREVYGKFGIDPATIDLVEAHGTGTVLGDPIEHAALSRAFSDAGPRLEPTWLGSVKSNIGHATTAAGFAGLAKVLWSLKHASIPPTLHFAGGNPAIDFAASRFQVNEKPLAWPVRADGKRRAAISSFGFGGTNAHLVVEEAKQAPSTPEPQRHHLFVLSARTPEQLRAQAARLRQHVQAQPDLLPEDVAFTLLAGRRHLQHRLALVADGFDALIGGLSAWLENETSAAAAESSGPEHAGGSRVGSLRTSEPGDSARVADLELLGRRFVEGGTLEARTLFSAGRRRVPLPTYLFGGKSYWVGPIGAAAVLEPERPLASVPPAAAAPTARSQSRQDDDPAPAPAARVRLGRPEAMAAAVSASSAVRSARVALAPVTQRAPQSPAGTIERSADREGVRVLTLSGGWGPEVAARLTQEVIAAGDDLAVRAVILAGRLEGQEQKAPAWNAEILVTCAVPVVAAFQGRPSGASAQMALVADFLVLGKSSGLDDIPAAGTALVERLYALRLGTVGPLQGIDGGTGGDGHALRERGIVIAPEGRLDETALTLARQIARAPRLPLVLLKRHMRTRLPLAGVAAAVPFRAEVPVASSAGEAMPVLASRKIPLASPVVALELFDDGVLVLRMLERDGRNMFTPALMDGLEEAFATIAELAAARVVVLTGHETFFACGGTAEGLRDLQSGGSRFTDRRIYALPLACDFPVIAALQGHGIGAGWALGLTCDWAIHAEEAVYHSNYLWYGFTPGAGVTLVLPHRLGDDLGREILFTAREYRGRELSQRSKQATVVPSCDVLTLALSRAHEMARLSRDRLLAMKRTAAQPLRDALETVLQQELAMHAETFIGNEDVRARIAEKFGAAEPATAPSPASASGDDAGIVGAVMSSLAEELMIDLAEIAPGASFIDLGLDSILAVTWIRRLNERFGIALPATAVYAHPTVGALAGHVARLMGDHRPDRSGPNASASVAPVPERAASATETPAVRQPTDALREDIVASLAGELMIDPREIEDRSGFLDLGLDSILAVTWIRHLNARYSIALPATAVYFHPSVGALVDHIATLLPPPERAAEEPARGNGAGAPVPPAAVPKPAAVAAPDPEPRPAAPPVAARADADARSDAIAIIGASGMFPKAADLDAFWRNIRDGVDCIGEVPASRWDIARFYDADPQAPGKTYCKWMGALDAVEAFDARFFGITPREAELMDPQQRLFLETAWHAIEDAAIDPARLAGSRCGIYVSSGPSGYEDLNEERNSYSLLGSSGSILASRIAYLLDLRGPCLSIDTACSSSLVALAEACESLVAGVCDLAISGGACVLVGPKMFVDTAKVSMLSADGRCFSFDERANGFVPGEGVGAVLLKRLADAQRDGDPIHAVIRGWGVNQDGRTNGITAPNPKAQTALIRAVHTRFGIDSATIGLVECHGTGTPLGDPIEVEGLTGAFDLPAGDACALGSVKSNVGHLLASAGIAGLLKAMLALENRQIPPSINIDIPNGHIAFEKTPFFVSRTLSEWPAPAGAPRRAGVSAFGFSGTNAHVVLEQSLDAPNTVSPTTGPWIFVLSARDRDQLIAYAGALERFVASRPELDLGSLAWTLQTGRAVHSERLAVVCGGRDELLRALASVAAGRPVAGVHLSAADGGMAAIFGTDEEAKALVARWLASPDPEQLGRAAKLWAGGMHLAWPAIAGARRIHIPAYPFATTRHWVDTPQAPPRPAGLPIASPDASALLGKAPAEGELGRRVIRLDGTEAYLTTHMSGEERLSLGLFLPEIARTTLERLSGTPVQRLQHLLWGGPVAINGHPRDMTVVVLSDAEGLLYRVEADGEGACHFGSAAPDEPGLPARTILPPGERERGTDAGAAYRLFADGCAIASGPPSPEMAGIGSVRRDAGTLIADLRLPRGAESPGHWFNPFFLDAVWRLLTFRARDGAGARPDRSDLMFPFSIEAMTGFAPLADTAVVRIRSADGDDAGACQVQLFDAEGEECLRLDGVKLVSLESSWDIHLDEEVAQ
jgi:acyl transferase domain-containing protein/acyl carrier protein/enoyl-CoA hydratase/carnithine racemase